MPFLGDDQPEEGSYNAIQSDLVGNGVDYPEHFEDDEVLQQSAAEADEEEVIGGNEEEDEGPTPVADMGEDLDAAPASARKAKTPRPTKKAPVPSTSGRKRKSVDADVAEDPTPAKQRGRPSRPAAATSARASVREASKPKRGRPKAAASSTATKTKGKSSGRPRKSADAVPANEYEVEEIVEACIDADSMQHMYFVKWKNYPASDNTWEPKSNLAHAMDLVRKFDASKKGKGSKAQVEPAEKERKKPGRKAKA